MHTHKHSHMQWFPPIRSPQCLLSFYPHPSPPIPTTPPCSFMLWGLSKTWPRKEKEQDGAEKEGEGEKKNEAPVLSMLGLSQRKQDRRRTFQRGAGSTLYHWSILTAVTRNLGQPFWSNVCDNTLWCSHLGCWTCQESTRSSSVYRKKKNLWGPARENGPCSLFSLWWDKMDNSNS